MPSPSPQEVVKAAVTPTRARRVVIPVALVLLGLITHGTYAGSGDEPHYLAIAHSIAFDGDLDLANNYGANEPLIGGGVQEMGLHARAGTGGIVRPVHDVGMPALFAPYVRVAAPLAAAIGRTLPDAAMRRLRLTPSTIYRHTISIAMIVVACFLAVQMLRFSEETTRDARASMWSALLIALSLPALLLSILFFTEVVTALLVVVVVRAFTTGRVERDWHAGLLGLCVGMLALIHARNVALVAVLGILGLVHLSRRGSLAKTALFVVGAAAPVAVRLMLTYAMWGTWVSTPHARFGSWSGWGAFVETVALRTTGLLLDQEYGLLPYAPVFLLAAFGVRALWRRSPTAAGAIAAVSAAYVASIVVPLVNPYGWSGGWSPPARFLMSVLPLLAPCLALGWRLAPRGLTVALVGLQLVISIYVWNRPKDFWNEGDGVAAVCARLGPTFCDVFPALIAPEDRVPQSAAVP